jgi:uncharacterized protein (TIGR03067 family)
MNAATRLILAMVALAAAVAVRANDSAERSSATKADLEKLQGRWKVVSLLIRGQEIEDFVKLGIIFDFKDEKLAVSGNSPFFATQNRILRVDANTTPKLLDFAETAKAFEEHKDVVEGVYTLDGDTMTWCFNLDGEQPAKANRPAAVESKPDSAAALIKLERAK